MKAQGEFARTSLKPTLAAARSGPLARDGRTKGSTENNDYPTRILPPYLPRAVKVSFCPPRCPPSPLHSVGGPGTESRPGGSRLGIHTWRRVVRLCCRPERGGPSDRIAVTSPPHNRAAPPCRPLAALILMSVCPATGGRTAAGLQLAWRLVGWPAGLALMR